MADEEKPAKKPLLPTEAKDYPVAKDIECTLPSGARAILHEPSKYVMLRTGQFPKDVAAAIREAATDGVSPDFDMRQKTLDVLLCKAFVEPKVSLTPRKDHVCVRELRDRDREFVAAILQLTVF